MSGRRATLIWGARGVEAAGAMDVCVIVDVLSFSTAVVAGCEAGARVYPYRWKDDSAVRFAGSHGAVLAGPRSGKKEERGSAAGAGSASQHDQPVSLSPRSLTLLEPGSRVVLPSPNGSTLSLLARSARTYCGCLRNAAALADRLNGESGDLVIVAAGERWPDGSLRPALEDLLGAGAIAAALNVELDVEAGAATAVFAQFADRLPAALRATASGRELIGIGFEGDVAYAGAFGASSCVPRLVGGAYRAER